MGQECGENKKNIMSKKIIYNDDARYTDAPPEVEESFARSKRIKNFLPPPSELVFKEEQHKEVCSSKRSVSTAYRKKIEYA